MITAEQTANPLPFGIRCESFQPNNPLHAPGGAVFAAGSAGELTIYLGPVPEHGSSSQAFGPYAKHLANFLVPALERQHHHAVFQCGFLDGAHDRPFVMVKWLRPGTNALERRYVLQELHRYLMATFAYKKFLFVLTAGCNAEQLVQIEDFALTHHDATYLRPKYEALRVIIEDHNAVAASDPWAEIRLRNQVTFRRWINEDPDQLTSIEIGRRIAAFCKDHGCHFESHDVESLRAKGLRLLLAVGQASERSPSRLHIATWNIKSPADAARALMLVGKGITFDTGGINLKAHENFVNCMRNDMGGAALTAATFMGLVEAKWPHPLILVIPSCENLIGELAVKPGAVVRSYQGREVMIEHTDAEGRLILADAISYAQERYKPRHTVSAATLTTASLRQFTNWFTPVHFSPAALQESLRHAGQIYGEQFTFWGEFLPFAQGNRSSNADLTNMGRMPSHASIGGGSNVAAHFLREFGGAAYTHLDIFASTWNWSGDYPGANYGATGAPFNSFFRAMSQFESWAT